MSGKKVNNVSLGNPAYSWEDLFGIDAGALTNATRYNFNVEIKNNDNGQFAVCYYFGTGALTTSQFNNLPIGSIIYATCLTAPAIYYHNTATTWKTQAINS
jgi:hypothetical protein